MKKIMGDSCWKRKTNLSEFRRIFQVLFFFKVAFISTIYSMIVLAHLGCGNRISCLTNKFISQSSGGYKVLDQGAGRLGVRWEPTPWFTEFMSYCLLTLLKDRTLISSVLYKAPTPLWGLCHHNLITSQRPLNTITLKIRFQHMNSAGSQTFSL